MNTQNKEIEQANRLIMESPFASDNHKAWIKKLIKFEGKPDVAFKEAKYHSSWDWLMPVVEKIEQLTTEDGRGTVNYIFSIEPEIVIVSVGGERRRSYCRTI